MRTLGKVALVIAIGVIVAIIVAKKKKRVMTCPECNDTNIEKININEWTCNACRYIGTYFDFFFTKKGRESKEIQMASPPKPAFRTNETVVYTGHYFKKGIGRILSSRYFKDDNFAQHAYVLDMGDKEIEAWECNLERPELQLASDLEVLTRRDYGDEYLEIVDFEWYKNMTTGKYEQCHAANDDEIEHTPDDLLILEGDVLTSSHLYTRYLVIDGTYTQREYEKYVERHCNDLNSQVEQLQLASGSDKYKFNIGDKVRITDGLTGVYGTISTITERYIDRSFDDPEPHYVLKAFPDSAWRDDELELVERTAIQMNAPQPITRIDSVDTLSYYSDIENYKVRVYGRKFDNAGFWGMQYNGTLQTDRELWVALYYGNAHALVAEVNLATLFSLVAEVDPDIKQLAKALGVRDDWHEPDEQGVTVKFDEKYKTKAEDIDIGIFQDGKFIEKHNLADLFYRVKPRGETIQLATSSELRKIDIGGHQTYQNPDTGKIYTPTGDWVDDRTLAEALTAAYYGDLKNLKKAFDDGINPLMDGDRFFILAAYKGHLNIVKYMLELGVDADIETKWGNALGSASTGRNKRNLDVVKYLVEQCVIDEKYYKEALKRALDNHNYGIAEYLQGIIKHPQIKTQMNAPTGGESIMEKRLRKIVRIALKGLDAGDCLFDMCPGPDKPFESMMTCQRCYAIQEIRKEMKLLREEKHGK